jgi:hypothetical protein
MTPAQTGHILRNISIGLVSAKFLVLGVGYVLYKVASPAGAASRKSLLSHTKELLKILKEQDRGLSEENEAEIKADLALLRKSIKQGWRNSAEIAALTRVLTFLSVEHTKDTAITLGDLVGSGAKSIWDAYENAMGSLFDTFVAPHFSEADYEGNVRRT